MSKDENELIQQRKKKIREMAGDGVVLYAHRYDAENTASEILKTYGKEDAEELASRKVKTRIAGRVVAMRRFGKAAFAHLQDSTGKIQIFAAKNVLSEEQFKLFKRIDIGDFIGVAGRLFFTKTAELTVEVHELTLLTKAVRALPEKWHGLQDKELRYRQRYLDLVANPEVKHAFVQRSRIINAIRDFMNRRGFIEVETPMMQPIPGGATARPFKTHHKALGVDLFLRIAPELYLKRLLVGGFERVYELNRNFRNEGMDLQHNPEFTMIEFYVAYADYTDLMLLTEELLAEVTERVRGTLVVEYKGNAINMQPPYTRIAYTEALEDALKARGYSLEGLDNLDALRKTAAALEIPVQARASRAKILDKLFESLVESKLVQPTFVVDYPTELSPLSKRKPDNLELVERFELFIAGKEIANAFSELNDPEDQRSRFEEQVQARDQGDDEAMFMDHDFVRALEYGMPPAAGEGIGIDRLVMLLTGNESIRDVILFPQMRPEV
ncbi:MAG: lysine--tRNA ligase [bacterium]|nr:lysine--tRNA ligase [bacterium]